MEGVFSFHDNEFADDNIFQGGRLGTPLFKRIYRAFIRNDRLSYKESLCNHEKTTPYLRIRDFSHRFPISNLTISRNAQFPNKVSE